MVAPTLLSKSAPICDCDDPNDFYDINLHNHLSAGQQPHTPSLLAIPRAIILCPSGFSTATHATGLPIQLRSLRTSVIALTASRTVVQPLYIITTTHSDEGRDDNYLYFIIHPPTTNIPSTHLHRFNVLHPDYPNTVSSPRVPPSQRRELGRGRVPIPLREKRRRDDLRRVVCTYPVICECSISTYT